MVLMCGTVLLIFQVSLPLMTASVLILLLCQTVLISVMNIPVFYLGSMPTSHDFHLAVYPFQELSAVIPSFISMPFPLPLRMESLCCPLLYSLYLP